MKKKLFLESDEYDIFIFPLPEELIKGKAFLSTIFPRKKMLQWTLSWMEKLHPCFDGRFIYDITFFREKGQVMALVTVAEKMKIASYLVKKHTALYVHRPDKRRVFSGRRPLSRLFVTAAVFCLFGTLVFSCLSFQGGKRGLETDLGLEMVPEPAVIKEAVTVVSALPLAAVDGTEELETEEESLVDLPESIEPTDSYLDYVAYSFEEPSPETSAEPEAVSRPPIPLEETPFIDLFLSCLQERGGQILGFYWRTLPSCSAEILLQGCWPDEVFDIAVQLCGVGAAGTFLRDDVPALTFSTVSCSDNIPVFSVLLDYSMFPFEDSSLGKGQRLFPLLPLLRKAVLKAGGRIVTESTSPPCLQALLPYDHWEEIAGDLVALFDGTEDWGLKSAELTTSVEDGLISISLFLSEESPLFFPVEKLTLLFPPVKEEELSCQELAELSEPVEEGSYPDSEKDLVTAQLFDKLVEIGSVRMDDGKYISFYRQDDGTIRKGEPYEK